MSKAYDNIKVSADYVKEIMPFEPEIGLVLGSGLGPVAETLEEKVEIEYSAIPNFLVSTAPDHAGKLIFGVLAGKKIVCMSGRFHYYEGYEFEQLAAPIRLLKLLGIKTVILTNAAGAVNQSYKCGDVMLISDHIKFSGASPMRGENANEFGSRFFDTTEMYTPSLRKLAKKCAEGSNIYLHEGVYFYMQGPQFETPAEIRAIRMLGGDAVGMSTVTEALTAAHCNLPCLAMSLITNMAAGITGEFITCEEVNETGRLMEKHFSEYIKKIVGAIEWL